MILHKRPAPSAARAARCHPIAHGEFTDFSFWRRAFLCDPAGEASACPLPP